MRKMKDSGVDWIGSVPEHWELRRAKSMFKQSTSKGNDRLVLLSATQDRGVVDKSTLDSVVQVSEDADLSTFKTVHKNDFVISLRSFQGGFEISHEEGVISPAYTVFRLSTQTYPHYYRHLFKSYGFIDKINSLTVGIREGKNIQYVDFANMLLPYISLAEQQRIAEFLDRKCTEVDEMIGLQEQIIEELKAYKQSVITEAVTKGLNPAAPMRDSGIEWIGQIPMHWETHPFKAFYKTTKGLNITKENLVESGMPVISYGQIHSKLNSGVRVNETLIRFVPEEYLTTNQECLSKQHDLFFADTSEDREGAGNVVYIDIDTPIFAGYHTIIARPSEKVKSKYFAYLIQTDAWRCQLRSRVSGVKVFSISQKFINQTSVIIPPISEQQAIANYLDGKCADIDSLIQTKQSKIDSLKEYKKSIIYEYVTGKREVNE